MLGFIKNYIYTRNAQKIVKLRSALLVSTTALDDLLNCYAEDYCNKERVKEAKTRIAEAGGTVAYIADVQQQNREALRFSFGASDQGYIWCRIFGHRWSSWVEVDPKDLDKTFPGFPFPSYRHCYRTNCSAEERE